jgi:hypothetical protein
MAEVEINRFDDARQYQSIMFRVRTILFDHAKIAAVQSKACSRSVILRIWRNEGNRYAAALPDNAEATYTRFFEAKVDNLVTGVLQKFDFKLYALMNQKYVELQAPAAGASIQRPSHFEIGRRRARGYQIIPTPASHDITFGGAGGAVNPTPPEEPRAFTIFGELPYELQLMIIEKFTLHRVVIWGVGNLPQMAEVCSQNRKDYMKKNPLKVFKNHDGTCTKFYTTSKDLVCILGEFPGFKRFGVDPYVPPSIQAIPPFNLGPNGTPIGKHPIIVFLQSLQMLTRNYFRPTSFHTNLDCHRASRTCCLPFLPPWLSLQG